MAIKNLGFGAFSDQLIDSGSASPKSTSLWAKETDAGGTETIEKRLYGAYQDMIVRSDGEVQTLTEFLDYKEGGGTETITGKITGAFANIVTEDGITLVSLTEKESGSGAVILKDPETPGEVTPPAGEKIDPVTVPNEGATIIIQETDNDAPETTTTTDPKKN